MFLITDSCVVWTICYEIYNGPSFVHKREWNGRAAGSTGQREGISGPMLVLLLCASHGNL